MSRLFSQSRQILVWFEGPSKVSYVIPLYSSLESSLGANLELSLDLRKSWAHQTQLQRILRTQPKDSLLCLPQNVTPLHLSFQAQKTGYKTVVSGREVNPPQPELR